MTLRTWVPSPHPKTSHRSLGTTCVPTDGYDTWPKYFKGPLFCPWSKNKGDLDLSGKVWPSSIVSWKNYFEKNFYQKKSIWVVFTPPSHNWSQIRKNKKKKFCAWFLVVKSHLDANNIPWYDIHCLHLQGPSRSLGFRGFKSPVYRIYRESTLFFKNLYKKKYARYPTDFWICKSLSQELVVYRKKMTVLTSGPEIYGLKVMVRKIIANTHTWTNWHQVTWHNIRGKHTDPTRVGQRVKVTTRPESEKFKGLFRRQGVTLTLTLTLTAIAQDLTFRSM